MAELVPLVMTRGCARVDRVTVLEAEHWADYPSSDIVCEAMGMGKSPDQFETDVVTVRRWMDGLFGEAIHLTGEALGWAVERVDSTLDLELADEAFEIAAGTIEAGTVAAQRYRWEGIVEGDARVIQQVIYRASPHVAPGWGSENGWDIRIEGLPPVHLTVGSEPISSGLWATAAHAVNAIPAVCRADPGIRTFLDLPPVWGRGSSG